MVFWAIVSPPGDYKYPPLGEPCIESDLQYGFRVIYGKKELDEILAKHPKTLWQDRYDMNKTFIGNDPRPIGMMKLPDSV